MHGSEHWLRRFLKRVIGIALWSGAMELQCWSKVKARVSRLSKYPNLMSCDLSCIKFPVGVKDAHNLPVRKG